MANDLITIKIEGIKEVQELLGRAPKLVVARGFLKALTAAGTVIKDEVLIRTPADTGDMRAALVMDVQLDSQFRGGSVDVGFGKQGHKANFVEYGHRMVTHKPKKREIGQVKPHPFMRPAADAAADQAIDAFAEALLSELKGELLDE